MMRRRRAGAIIVAVMIAVSLLLPAVPGAIVAGNPGTADAERTIDPQTTAPGGTVQVTVEFTSMLEEPTSFILHEVVPAGWTIARGVDDATAFDADDHKWLWMMGDAVDPGETKTVTYSLHVPLGTDPDGYTIGGTVLAAGVHNVVGGHTAITVEVEVPPDGTAAATRIMDPQTTAPGGTVQVTVEFTSLLPETASFILHEVVPAGWTVTRGVDDATEFDPDDNKWLWMMGDAVEAGETKTVTYDLHVPPGTDPAEYTVGGTVLAAGIYNTVGGHTAITVGTFTAHASRSITPKVVEPGGQVWVTVEFTSLLEETTSFILHEVVPAGWTVSRGVDDASGFDAIQKKWLWMMDQAVEAGETKTVTYTLSVPVGTAPGVYGMAGTVLGAGEYNPVLGDATITVETEKPPHDPPKPRYYGLWLDSTDGGSVTSPGEGLFAYEQFSKVNLVATPAQGYRFAEWVGDVRQVDDVELASAEVTMSYHYFITAVFELDEEVDPAVEYDLTILSSEGGSVTIPGEGEFTYPEGTVVDLVAVADAGHAFLGWIGDTQQIADTTSAQTTITMQGHYTIGAVFVEHTLTVDSTGGGSVTDPGEGEFTYLWGTVVDLEAVADEGYRFVEWTGDIDDIANVGAAQTTIAMYDSYSITANFEEIPTYDLTIGSTAGGSVTTPGEGVFTYDDGTVVNLVAQAAENYNFVNWTGDTGTIGNVNAASTTITMQGDYSITANFEEDDDWERPTGCFIATAAYGTPSAGEIDVLRQFRDVVLLESEAGSRFVAWYYGTSPPIARFLAGHELLRTFTREFLVNPLVWLVEATSFIWHLS